MLIRKFGISLCSIALCIVLALASGCGSPPVITTVLPENVMAHPPHVVGVVSLDTASPIYTALRALGVRYHRVPIDSLTRYDRYRLPIVILDRELLEDERVAGAWQIFLDHIRKGGTTLMLLQQQPETMRKLASRYSNVLPRPVAYSLSLVLPQPDHPVATTPNRILDEDLDSLSLYANQLALGDRQARAIISANLQSPDSSAAILLAPNGRGAVWYIGMPIMARAAAGYPAEQRLLANILSYDATGWRKER
jgi:hypothetical protein